ncbi:MAG: GNAT family N-acetyltransferase [Dermatophilaceae bacterium]
MGTDHPHPHEHERGPLADASVRRARVSDAPAIGVVQATVFTEAYAAVLAPEVIALFEPVAFARAWRDSLESPPEGAHALFVALAGAQVVGLAAVGPSQDADDPGDAGEVTVIAVHAAARRQGHGSRLLNAGADHLRAAGAASLAVWVPLHDEGTRQFLAGAGLAPDGAFRDRVVSPDGQVLREVRLACTLDP